MSDRRSDLGYPLSDRATAATAGAHRTVADHIQDRARRYVASRSTDALGLTPGRQEATRGA